MAGLCGLGDLVLTCSSPQSRNMSVGLALGRGQSLEEALAGKVSVAEGVASAPAVRALGLRLGVELPICEAVAAVLVWDSSTAYNHCWLILPIAGWLAWSRRDRLAVLLPAPNPWLALLALPLGAVWLVAERLAGWDERELVAEIELQTGRDLQYIRVNGALVGAVAGLGIHAIRTLMGGP